MLSAIKRYKRALSVLSLSVFSALLACTPAPPSSPTVEGVSEPTDAEIQALVQTYRDLSVLNAELEPSNIHGSQVKTFMDAEALKSYQEQRFPYADGSVSLKESYNGSGEIQRLYMMQKIEGYDSNNNDWFYAVMSPEGEVRERGKVGYCISCHARVRDRDFLYGFD